MTRCLEAGKWLRFGFIHMDEALFAGRPVMEDTPILSAEHTTAARGEAVPPTVIYTVMQLTVVCMKCKSN